MRLNVSPAEIVSFWTEAPDSHDPVSDGPLCSAGNGSTNQFRSTSSLRADNDRE